MQSTIKRDSPISEEAERDDRAHVPTIADLSGGEPRPWIIPTTFVAAVLAGVVTIAAADAYYTDLTRSCAALELATLVVLAIRYVRVRPPRLPWIELVYAVHCMQFGVAIFGEPAPVGLAGTIPSSGSHESAAVLALVTSMVMVGSFAGVRRLLGRWQKNPLIPTLHPTTLAQGSTLYVACCAAYVIVKTYLPSLAASFGIFTAIVDNFFGYGPLIVIPSLAFLARPGARTGLLFLAALAAVVASVVASSMLNNLLFPLIAVGVLWWRARERIPLIPVLLAVTTLVFVQPAKAYYRRIHWHESANTSILDAWSQAFEERASDARSSFTGQTSNIDSAQQRMNALSTCAFVLDTVPASIPYAGGAIYEVLTYAYIPRLIWPDKPNMTTVGTDPSAIAVGLTDRDMAENSTVGMALTTQGYYEHGVGGAIAWMALVGALLALFCAYFGPSLAGTIGSATLIATWVIGLDAGFLGTFGGVPQSLFATTMLSWVMKWLGSRTSSNAAGSSLLESS